MDLIGGLRANVRNGCSHPKGWVEGGKQGILIAGKRDVARAKRAEGSTATASGSGGDAADRRESE